MKDLVYFFHLSRPINVLISLMALLLGTFLTGVAPADFLVDAQFWYSLVAVGIISMTGYWVNDAFDFKIDRINKPRRVIVNAHLSVKIVLTVYFSLVGLLLIGSWFLQPMYLWLTNLSAAAMLFLYAAYLPRTTVVGKLVIAALTATVLYYAALLYQLTSPLLWTTVFAFQITFLRELVKDIEDIEGDLHFKLQTLPIRIGIVGARNVLLFAIVIMIMTTHIPFWLGFIRTGDLNWPYLAGSLALIQIPLVYLILRLRRATQPTDFKMPSQLLKIFILTGMLSVLFLL